MMKAVVAALLLGLWVPTTSHALLEQFNWIHTDYDATSGDNDHDAADGICLLTPGQTYHPDMAESPLTPAAPVSNIFDECEPATTAMGPDPPGTAPPEVFRFWHFSHRASLPPRAPSLFV
jgi:hypothetical protein